MNNEDILLKYFIINKEIYLKYKDYLNKEYIKSLFKEHYKILLVVDEWYSIPDSQAFQSIQDFQAIFFANYYPRLKKADQAVIEAVFKRLDGINISEEVLGQVLEAHRKRAIASEIAGIALDISEGKREFLELPAALERHSQDNYGLPAQKIEFVTDDLEELYQSTYGQPGLPWRLKTLRRMMGSLRKGDFGFLFARPEVGKTTFLADNGSYFAKCGATVLHFNNEETDRKIKIRYYQAALGTTTRELFNDFKGSQRRYEELVGSRIKIVPDDLSRRRGDIESVIEATNPGVIIIDSIDKVEGFEDDRDDLRYKAIYGWARQLAKRHAPVIGVCHAAVSGEGKKYLEMDDVAYAKTAKQAEADWILGIGQSHNPNDGEFTRFLHLPKNKLMGDDEMREEYRHGKLMVRIYPEIAQFDDVIDWSNHE